MILIFLKILSLLLFGYSFVKLIGFKRNWIELLGLSFLTGTGLMTVIFFLFGEITNNIKVGDFWLIVLLLTMVCLIFKRLSFNFKKVKLKKIKILPNLIPILCWGAIFVIFFASLVYTLYTPIYTVDSLGLFDLRSKVMFLSQRLSNIKLIDSWYLFPMFTSMIGLIWRFVGVNPGSYFPLMYMSFALIFYSTLRLVVNKNLASIGTLFMYTSPITLWQSQIGVMTNASYTIFLSLSILYIFRILISKERNLYDVILSSIFLGLSMWTRATEPLWVIPLFLAVIILLIRKRIIWMFVYIPIFYSMSIVWPLYSKNPPTQIVTATNIVIDYAVKNQDGVYGFFPVLIYTIHSIVKTIPESLGLVVYLFIFVLVCDVVSGKFGITQKYYSFAIFGILAILFFGSLFMVLHFHVRLDIYNDTLSRLMSIFSPLLWFYIITDPVWNSVRSVLKFKEK